MMAPLRAHSMKSFTTGVSVRFFSVMTPTGQGSTTCPRVVSGARGRMALAPKGASAAPTSPQNTALAGSRELVDRLLSQVEALKSEVRELTEAQQQPAQANAAIQAEQESRHRVPPVHWPRCAVVRGRERT